MIRRIASAALALVAALALAAPSGGGRSRSPACGAAGPLSYGWPLRPFDRQHPVRGNFGDPRTVSTERLGRDRAGSPGDYSFHNGIDVSAPAGTPVYPVVSGTAHLRHAREVIVTTEDGRHFQYWHVVPAVSDGVPVVARRTVLGFVQREFDHVHLSEIDGFRIHNPAAPGHITPYRDGTPPLVKRIEFHTSEGRRLEPDRLHGPVQIAAEADDTPPLPVPGAWYGFPVTPALVRWQMTAADGRVVAPLRTAADFRRTEPPNTRFWRVYAAGTYQNFPVFQNHYFFRVPGRYLFRLTHASLDTRRLPNGLYVITVVALDVCGNRGSLDEPIRIAN